MCLQGWTQRWIRCKDLATAAVQYMLCGAEAGIGEFSYMLGTQTGDQREAQTGGNMSDSERSFWEATWVAWNSGELAELQLQQWIALQNTRKRRATICGS